MKKRAYSEMKPLDFRSSIRKLRIWCTVLLLGLLSAAPLRAAADDGKRVSITCTDQTVEWVLDRIETQTRYNILIRNNDVDMSRRITLTAVDQPVETVLSSIFAGTEVKWTISGSRISIYKPQRQARAEERPGGRTLSGRIVDQQGTPVAGAAVLIAGTTVGTSSASDGSWTLAAPESARELQVSFLGYTTQTVAIEGRTSFEIVLAEEAASMDEVVVVGYGVQKKSVVTAAISSLKGDKLSVVTPTRMDNALKGMVSGVSITSASGQPGEGTRVRIRGIGTINNSNPLYIVDGMPVSSGIEYINPADIESIEVLKDAASAAIYGSRGANGVILVTTKKGAEGRVTVDYNFSYGWQNPWRKLDMLDAAEYATIINEMNLNDGKAPVYDNPRAFGKGTNWQDEVFNRNAPVVDHQLSISGGNSRGNYYLSASYFNQEGIIGGNYNQSNYERMTLRSNNNYTLFDAGEKRDWLRSLKLGTNVSFTHDRSHTIASNSERSSVLGSALALSPMLPVYAENPDQLLAEHPAAVTDAQGRPFSIAGDEFAAKPNPLAMLNMPVDTNFSDKLVANFYADFELYKNLHFKSTFGAELDLYTNDGYELPYYLNSTRQSDASSVWSTMTRCFSWQVENTLSYNFTIAGRHNFTLLIGQSASSYRERYVSGTSYQIRDASQPWIDATDQDVKMRSASAAPSPYSRLASYFGRIGYNFDERYMVEFTFRRDGSSNFSPENKWANFPSVSVGWNLTNEPFMANRPKFLSTVKLRASWGLNGNQNIGSFRYTSMMRGGANYLLGLEGAGSIVSGSVPQSYTNANLKWEESEQTDVGIDLAMFDNRLSLSLDYYDKRTNGMLMEMSLPGYIGNTRPTGNVGDMKNSGFEFDLSFKTRISDVELNFGANGSYNRNKLVKLGNDTASQNYDTVHGSFGSISRAENGEPFPFFYGWKTAGIFQTREQVAAYVNDRGELLQPDAVPGDVIFVDMDGNGVIDDADRTKLGKGMPDWTFGFNVGLAWKGIDFNAFFHATVGNDIYDATLRTDYPKVNLPSYILGRWCGPGTSDRLPRLTSQANGGPNRNWRSSDLFVYDGSFLRLRSIQLGYTLPRHITAKFFVSRLRVYVSAENLFTATRYHGFDPEISSGGTSLGIDKGIYPQPRIFSVGANITF